MAQKRPIDERDIDDLLAALTDRQIADLFELLEEDVAKIRQQRRTAEPIHRPQTTDSEEPEKD